jgi:CheY-like chemotaxis protein
MAAKTNNNKNGKDTTPLIILADDDPSIRLILHHILQRDGYRVIDANNGREALRLFQDHPADLVLLDAIMPEQDGFVTCRMLKELRPELPVLMITGLDDDQSVEHAFRVGADDYISKPINWSVLKHRIARALSLITPHRVFDELVLSNALQTRYTTRMNLADESITGIEVRADIPVTTVMNAPATNFLINQFAENYQEEKKQHATASLLSIPLNPTFSSADALLATLKNLDKKFGIPLSQLELRIHECHFYHESIRRLLPLLSPSPVQLCIDAFSFSLRSLDYILENNFKHIMIDITATRKHLAENDLWLGAALQIYKDNEVTVHACNIIRPDDLQLAIRLGCVSASE